MTNDTAPKYPPLIALPQDSIHDKRPPLGAIPYISVAQHTDLLAAAEARNQKLAEIINGVHKVASLGATSSMWADIRDACAKALAENEGGGE